MARPKKQTNNELPFYNKYNRHLYVEQKPTEYPPSETVQGQSMSMAEMIRAFTRGEIPPMAESAFHGYDVDIDQHHGSRMPSDITEVEELQRQHLREQVEREAFAQDPREAEGKMTKAEAEESTERAQQSDTQHEA